MNTIKAKHGLYTGVCAALLGGLYAGGPLATWAAEPPNLGNDDNSALGEIIVTANRREARIQDTPIAINAFTSTDIEQNRIYEFGDLAARVPGFSVNSFSKARTNPALRGGSSNLTGPGSDNAIAVFVDDVYYGNAADFEFDFFNLERIEVLRGPQGTLFGRNSTGGSINVVTKDPTKAPEGAVEVGIGNYNLVQSRGFVSGALNASENLLGSISFSSTNRRGTSFNRTTGNYIDNMARQSGRAKLKWILSERSDLTLTADFGTKDETNTARAFVGPTPTVPLITATGFVPSTNPWVVDNFQDGRFKSDSWGASAKFNVRYEPGTFTSITSYRNLRLTETPEDFIGARALTASLADNTKYSQYTQELRWVSKASDAFNWVGGLYYLHQDDQRHQFTATQYDPNAAIGGPQASLICPATLQDPVACAAAFPALWGVNHTQTLQNAKVDSFAVYGQGTLNFTDQLSFTLGGRVTHDQKSSSGTKQGDPDIVFRPAGPYSIDNVSDHWTAFTPKAVLEYKITPSVMVYASAARGFRSGSFQFESDPVAARTVIKPEYVWSYEVGEKSRFWKDRAEINLALFSAHYKGYQFSGTVVDANGNPLFLVGNVENKVDGAELEFRIQPVHGLTASLNYSYLHGVADHIPAALLQPPDIFNGITPPQTPKHSLVLALDYEYGLSNGMSVDMRVDDSYKSPYNLELTDNIAQRSAVPRLLNAGLALESADRKWEYTLWGKNLTNQAIVEYGGDFRFVAYRGTPNELGGSYYNAYNQSNFPRYQPPRTFGLSVKYSY